MSKTRVESRLELEEGSEVFLKCQVAPGIFTTERTVFIPVGTEGPGRWLWVSERDVQTQQEIEVGKRINGLLRVRLMEQNGSTALVYLPRETTIGEHVLKVPISSLVAAQSRGE